MYTLVVEAGSPKNSHDISILANLTGEMVVNM